MRNTFISLITFSFLFSCTVSNDYEVGEINDYPGADFEYVYAYKMKNGDKNVIENNILSGDVILPGVELTDEQAFELIKIFTSRKSYGSYPARCFNPHLGFVFYNKNNSIVAHSSICFDCNWMSTEPDIGPVGFSTDGTMSLQRIENEIFEMR